MEFVTKICVLVLGLLSLVPLAQAREHARQQPRELERFATVDPRYEKRAQKRVVDFRVPVASNEIKIMDYNVENLFDAVHDEGKSDWEFLPANHPLKKNCESEGSFKKLCYETDWTPARLDIKLRQIKRAVDAQGVLPDILTLEEVENENVVAMLAKELGFERFVVSNSPDERGIDVAVLFNETKIRLLNSQEKKLDLGNTLSRNLLVANFELKGSATKEVLGVFVNHWPSQGKSSEVRFATAQQLKSFVDEQATKHSGYHAVLSGDFNTIDADRPHPINEVILNTSWKMGFADVQILMDRSKNRKAVLEMPPGTYFYFGEGTWNRLDRFFVSQSLLGQGKGAKMVEDSFRVVAPEFMCRAYEYFSPAHHLFQSVIFGVPMGSNHNAVTENEAGFSDHFPIVMKLKTN